MKHRLYIILLLATVCISSMAQTIGEAFYVYRNDGMINTFFRSEIAFRILITMLTVCDMKKSSCR